MPNPVDNEWSRRDAEVAVAEVLKAAKAGRMQKILDFDGAFEIRFVRAKTGITANEFLAQGGPLDE